MLVFVFNQASTGASVALLSCVCRSGRTGRAGKTGTAVVLFTDRETRTLGLILQATKVRSCVLACRHGLLSKHYHSLLTHLIYCQLHALRLAELEASVQSIAVRTICLGVLLHTHACTRRHTQAQARTHAHTHTQVEGAELMGSPEPKEVLTQATRSVLTQLDKVDAK